MPHIIENCHDLFWSFKNSPTPVELLFDLKMDSFQPAVLLICFAVAIRTTSAAHLISKGIALNQLFNKRQKMEQPQVYSGPYPCLDKSGSPQVPPYLGGPPFWFTDDKCHQSYCPGPMVLTKSVGCFLKGAICPPGAYLDVPAEPKSPFDCCLCKPMESLRKRNFNSRPIKPSFDHVVQKQASHFVLKVERENWQAAKRSRTRKLMAKYQLN